MVRRKADAIYDELVKMDRILNTTSDKFGTVSLDNNKRKWNKNNASVKQWILDSYSLNPDCTLYACSFCLNLSNVNIQPDGTAYGYCRLKHLIKLLDFNGGYCDNVCKNFKSMNRKDFYKLYNKKVNFCLECLYARDEMFVLKDKDKNIIFQIKCSIVTNRFRYAYPARAADSDGCNLFIDGKNIDNGLYQTFNNHYNKDILDFIKSNKDNMQKSCLWFGVGKNAQNIIRERIECKKCPVATACDDFSNMYERLLEIKHYLINNDINIDDKNNKKSTRRIML